MCVDLGDGRAAIVAARNADAARARIARRSLRPTSCARRRSWTEPPSSGRPETFLATAHATSELNATAESANAILEGADPSDRRAAKAREALSAMSTQAWAWADEAIAARRRVNDESASVAATADAPALAQAPSEPVAPAGEPDAPKNADRESGMSAGRDIFDQIASSANYAMPAS
jgi:hypothetical protein